MEEPAKKPRKGGSLWIWVALAFVVLIAAWTFLIVLAVRNQPEVIQLQNP